MRSLTPREREVLDQLTNGLSEKEVARVLGLSRHTVHGHVKQLHVKLNVSTRAQLLLTVMQPASDLAFSA